MHTPPGHMSTKLRMVIGGEEIDHVARRYYEAAALNVDDEVLEYS